MNKFWIPFIFFTLTFYCFGAGIMDSFVIYNSWRFVSENEFAAMHQASGERIVLLLVLPMLALTVFCVLMFWHRPFIIPKKLVVIALLSLMAGWLSSAFIQIPIQVKLGTGKNDHLLNKLIITDWIRIAAWIPNLGAVILMILKLYNHYTEGKYFRKPEQEFYHF